MERFAAMDDYAAQRCQAPNVLAVAKTIASGVGMTNDWLASRGVLSLKTLWAGLAHLRGTAAALLCVEPTRPNPPARWCREGARKRASLPDFGDLLAIYESGDQNVRKYCLICLPFA